MSSCHRGGGSSGGSGGLSGGSGSSGGGGAVSEWFLGAVAVLSLLRFRSRSRG